MHFKNKIFDVFCRFYGLTSDAIFSVIWPCRMLFSTILKNYKEKSFQRWFWNLSHVFESGHKMHFKNKIFYVFCRFFGLTSDAIFSVIWPCRMLWNTLYYGTWWQNNFRKDFSPYISKMVLKPFYIGRWLRKLHLKWGVKNVKNIFW